jgi:RHS repeat-associated protein
MTSKTYITNYSPFGALLQNRNFTGEKYRYGFQGQERDDEIAGNGNSYTAEFWQYDTRLGRRWNIDPMASKTPGWSPFRAFNDNSIFWTDPTGLLEDNYSVDKEGNVKLEEKTDDDFDMLYTKSDWDKGNKDNGLKVNDKSVLPELTKSRLDFVGNYVISNNKSDLFNVFYFAANNTNVEWGIDGYRTDGNNEYILTTSHGKDYVHSSTLLKQYNEFKMIFNMHTHPGSDGTRGGRETSVILIWVIWLI